VKTISALLQQCGAACFAGPVLISCLALALWGQQAPAPDNRPTVSLSPAVIMARGTFGQSLTEVLTLSNQTPRGFAFEMAANDVVVRDGKREFVPAGETPHSIAGSAVFSQRSGVVKPFSSASVEVRVTAPAETEIRAIVAIFRGTGAVGGGAGSVGLTASLGALITFNLSDKVKVDAGPVQVSPASDASNLRVAQLLTNTGGEPVLPEGVAVFLDSKGKLVGKTTFPMQRLLPGERLEFASEYPGRLPAGAYRVLCSFRYEGQDLTTSGTFDNP
jgi:hypothetical protein